MSGAMLRLQMMSGIFWPSGDDGSEFEVCGDVLRVLERNRRKQFMIGANRENIPEILA